MLRHLGPVSLFSKVRHPTSLPGSENEKAQTIYASKKLTPMYKGICDYSQMPSLQKDLPSEPLQITY